MKYITIVKHLTIIITISTLLITPLMAQVSKTPEIAKKIRKLGAKADMESIKYTLKLYRKYHAADSGKDLKITVNQAYGKNKLQKLDVFAPKKAKKLPVLVFTHGGGFVGGDKSSSHNIGRWAARNGMVGVTINYRLAPKHKWPSGAKDLAKALKWVKGNIKRLGGDPDRIVVAGESAGSIHTSDYIFREDLQVPNDGVIGAILISLPTTDLEAPSSQNDPKRDLNYYGEKGDRHKQSVVNAVSGRKIPVLISYSEYEPDFILDQTLRLIEAIARRDGSKNSRKMPLIISAMGHNHISISQHIGTADKTLAPQILEFIFSLKK